MRCGLNVGQKTHAGFNSGHEKAVQFLPGIDACPLAGSSRLGAVWRLWFVLGDQRRWSAGNFGPANRFGLGRDIAQ